MSACFLSAVLIVSAICNVIIPVTCDGIDDILEGLTRPSDVSLFVQENSVTPQPGVCGEEQICVQKTLCTNASVTGELEIDIRFDKDNPCVDYLLQCCYTSDVIQAPPTVPVTPVVVPTDPKKTPATTKPTVQPTICGIRQPEGVGFRIVNAQHNESEYGEFPWMLAIVQRSSELEGITVNRYRCGASLIHPRVALTAAHCVRLIPQNEIMVRAGEWDTQTTNEMFPTQDLGVSEVVLHPDYYKAGQHNDIALLILNSAMELNEVVQTICLPEQNANFDRQRCFVSGWGKDKYGTDGAYQVILKKIDLPVIPSTQCETTLRTTRLGPKFLLHNSFVCAGGEPGKDACLGDGGSPLVCPIEGTNQYHQAGIVAWGLGCGDAIPGIYVKVALFSNWINQQMKQRNIGAF